jgi:hypothetical protein
VQSQLGKLRLIVCTSKAFFHKKRHRESALTGSKWGYDFIFVHHSFRIAVVWEPLSGVVTVGVVVWEPVLGAVVVGVVV